MQKYASYGKQLVWQNFAGALREHSWAFTRGFEEFTTKYLLEK